MCINCLECTKFLAKKCDQSKEYQQQMLHRSIHQEGVRAWVYRNKRRVEAKLDIKAREITIEGERMPCMRLVG